MKNETRDLGIQMYSIDNPLIGHCVRFIHWSDANKIPLSFKDLRIVYQTFVTKYSKLTRDSYRKFLWDKELKKYIIEKFGAQIAFNLNSFGEDCSDDIQETNKSSTKTWKNLVEPMVALSTIRAFFF